MINERMSVSESSTDQSYRNVAWEGAVYSQGSRSSLENIVAEDSSNEVVQRLEQEITELKDKHNEEMSLMKQNQEKMQSELLQMRQLMHKYVSNEFMPQSINGTSGEQSLSPTTAMNEYHKHQEYLVLLKILHFLKIIHDG